MGMYDYKQVRSHKDLGQGEHFAVIKFGSVHVPGDQRSREDPGHGYPAYDAPTVEYLRFDDEDALKSWIATQDRFHTRNFAVIRASQVEIQRTVEIKIAEKT